LLLRDIKNPIIVNNVKTPIKIRIIETSRDSLETKLNIYTHPTKPVTKIPRKPKYLSINIDAIISCSFPSLWDIQYALTKSVPTVGGRKIPRKLAI
jgi:hypothetical protein